MHLQLKKMQHKLKNLKSKTRHLSRFATAKSLIMAVKSISRRMSDSVLIAS